MLCDEEEEKKIDGKPAFRRTRREKKGIQTDDHTLWTTQFYRQSQPTTTLPPKHNIAQNNHTPQ